MQKSNIQNYFELNEANNVQNIVFLFLTLLVLTLMIYCLYPILDWLFVDYLKGNIVNNGELVAYTLDNQKIQQPTNLFFSWAIDVYIGTEQEARYWFNPVLSLFIPVFNFAFFIAFCISTLFPQKYGLAHHKIEREIASILDKICLSRFGYHSNEERELIAKELLNADLRNLHDFEIEWGYALSDLIVIHKALKWKNGNLLWKSYHLNDGLSLYLKLYVNIKYSNAILGFVYVGAAVLIVIIGLRGLKFIPSTEPSLVFFALGLEFSLLLTYAVTLMYAREEEIENNGKIYKSEESYMSNEFSDEKELESLLRVFIMKDKVKDK
jgi:hypothetical protein